jgi:thiol:disulfide interchange protein DsbD
MEENVWTQSEVSKFIKENFILVSLYVDDKEKLPVNERFIYRSDKKDDGVKISVSVYDKMPTEKQLAAQSKKEIDIKTIGDKWSAFQSENFTQASQPLYVLLNDDEQLLNYPVGYTPDAQKYLQWLQCGKDTFDKKK